MRSIFRSVVYVFLLAAFGFCLTALPAAAADLKEEVLARYGQAVSQMEELNVYAEDVFNIIPRIRQTSRALLENDFEKAGEILTGIEKDLDLLKTRKPVSIQTREKFVWMELYLDLFQKFVYVLLFAYLFARWPYFNRALSEHRFSLIGRLYVALIFSSLAILLSFFDLARYGESAWGYFDIQIVFVTLSALLGGFWVGLLSGSLIGVFRWLLKPDAGAYVLVALAAGLLGGLFARRIRHVETASKTAFAAGAAVGLMHGLVIYVPLARFMPWFYFVFTVMSLALLEGGAVLLFFKTAADVIHRQRKRELENEYLKTRVMLLQAQMSPHFLFNALNTIAAICSREKAADARRLVLRLAECLRRAVRQDEKVTLREELEFIDAYLEIEKARFEERLKVEKKIALEEADWNLKIPLLILQPLVENAVRHGISKKESGGTVQICLSSDKNQVEAEIFDDGIGMDPGTVLDERPARSGQAEEGLGIGLRNIHERLVKIYGENSGLEIEAEKGWGTRIRIQFPKTKEKP